MANPLNPVFPAHIPTDLDLMVATNSGLSQLGSDITSNTTSIPVIDATKFVVPCLVKIDAEIIRVGDKSGNTLISCTRGFDNTNASTHTSGAFVKAYILAHHHNQITAEIKAICDALGVNLANVITVTDQAGGEITGTFYGLHLGPNGIVPGAYGAADKALIPVVDAAGRVSSIDVVQASGSGNRVLPIFYKAAIAQGSNAVLGFNFALGQAPSAVLVTGANQVYAVAEFTEANNYWVQDHFTLPDDWTGAIDLDIYWRAGVTIGGVIWQIETAGMRDMSQSDIAWNAMSYINDLATTPVYGINKCTISNINCGTIQPGDEFFFKFSRSATDTMSAPAQLISLRFRVRRNWNLNSTMA